MRAPHCYFVSQIQAAYRQGSEIKLKTEQSILHLSVATLLPFFALRLPFCVWVDTFNSVYFVSFGMIGLGRFTPRQTGLFIGWLCFFPSTLTNEISALIPIAVFD